MVRRSIVVLGLFGGLLWLSSAAMAQEDGRHEVTVQGTGFFTKNSQGNGILQHTTDTGGLLANYRFQRRG